MEPRSCGICDGGGVEAPQGLSLRKMAAESVGKKRAADGQLDKSSALSSPEAPKGAQFALLRSFKSASPHELPLQRQTPFPKPRKRLSPSAALFRYASLRRARQRPDLIGAIHRRRSRVKETTRKTLSRRYLLSRDRRPRRHSRVHELMKRCVGGAHLGKWEGQAELGSGKALFWVACLRTLWRETLARRVASFSSNAGSRLSWRGAQCIHDSGVRRISNDAVLTRPIASSVQAAPEKIVGSVQLRNPFAGLRGAADPMASLKRPFGKAFNSSPPPPSALSTPPKVRSFSSVRTRVQSERFSLSPRAPVRV
eukprot:scaffold7040_cov256-Pinguiococcus_pyrenoidosus.AAC.23